MRRVDEAIKAVVSETIPTLKDPRIGFVTVTGVVTTSDLAQATVWLSVYGGENGGRRPSPRSRRRRHPAGAGQPASSICVAPLNSSSNTISRSSTASG